jgi:NACalpha-BTF3-like transcription factor
MDPLKQQQLAMPTVEVYLAIEEQLLLNIAKQLKKHQSLMTEDDIVSWQTQHLSAVGQLSQQNIVLIAKYAQMSVNEVSKALEQAGYETVGEYEGSLQEAVAQGILIQPPSVEASMALQDVLATYQQKALNTFNLVNATLLKTSQQAYLDVVNQTVGKVLSGSVTPQQALRESISKLSKRGAPALIDKAGKHWSTDTYMNMVMRSTVNNVANAMQDARMDDYGVDLVEISSHMGARPKCAPFQGKIFSRSGYNNRFPSLSTTSYGQPDGLFGINCRHIKYPYIPGLSIKRYQPYNEKKNRERYEQMQQQRYLERRIREAKREVGMMNAVGDEIGMKMARKKLKDRQADMRNYIANTGLRRNRDREQVG